MTSNNPTRRTTRNLRKTENVIPQSVTNPVATAQGRSAGQSSKLPVPASKPPSQGASRRATTATTRTNEKNTEVKIVTKTKRKRTTPLAERSDDRNAEEDGARSSKKLKGKAREVPKPTRRLPSRKSAVRVYSPEPEQVAQAEASSSAPIEDPEMPVAEPAVQDEPPDNASGQQLSAIQEQESEDEDIDAGDFDDPGLVSEYVEDVMKHLRSLEAEYTPSPTYLTNQIHVTSAHRTITLDFLLSIHCQFTHYHPETFLLAVNIFDRMLSARQVSVQKIQLVAIVSLYVAGKYEEIMSPELRVMLEWAFPELVEPENQPQGSEDEWDEDDPEYQRLIELWMEKKVLFHKAEMYVLRTIQYGLSYPSPLVFLRRASKADGLDPKPRLVGKYLIELGMIDDLLIGVPGSLLATAALCVGRWICRKGEWTKLLTRHTTYTLQQVLPVASKLITSLLRSVPEKRFPTLWVKWAGKSVQKVSIVCRVWATKRWHENEVVQIRMEDVSALCQPVR